MPKYQIGDIECSALSESAGKFRARVRVAGHRLQPFQVKDYVYESSEFFDDENLALQDAKTHANENFPAELGE